MYKVMKTIRSSPCIRQRYLFHNRQHHLSHQHQHHPHHISSDYLRNKPPTHVITAAAASLDAPIASKPNTIINLNIKFDSFYRVVLIYNNWTDDKAIGRAILRAIPSLKSASKCLHIARAARSEGRAIVLTAIKDEAKKHIRALTLNGLDAELDEA